MKLKDTRSPFLPRIKYVEREDSAAAIIGPHGDRKWWVVWGSALEWRKHGKWRRPAFMHWKCPLSRLSEGPFRDSARMLHSFFFFFFPLIFLFWSIPWVKKKPYSGWTKGSVSKSSCCQALWHGTDPTVECCILIDHHRHRD